MQHDHINSDNNLNSKLQYHDENEHLENENHVHEHHEHERDESHRLDIKALPAASVVGKPVYRVKIYSSNETIFCVPENEIVLSVHDQVVATTRYGKDLGLIQCGPVACQNASEMDVYPIHRKATENDLQKIQMHREKEGTAFKTCRQKILEHGLEMKLVATHYLLEEPKILFFFTAENRVDFRELVKDLVSIFKMRIELRQIGVRDEARVLGGIGICGRSFCCHAVTDKLNPVSIKMAKEQNISLNSLKISGPCGRLLCCLGYEYDFYHCEKSSLPEEGRKFVIDKEEYYITEVNVIMNVITMKSVNGRFLNLPTASFHRDENGHWEVNSEPIGENSKTV
ncbi:MAG: hypothetical protein EHM28_10955 [Spirochaetaceae bacterium]|nr:MAG: hypothetical protein EHM28_10955 [Spirochaetaceae bacterium]